MTRSVLAPVRAGRGGGHDAAALASPRRSRSSRSSRRRSSGSRTRRATPPRSRGTLADGARPVAASTARRTSASRVAILSGIFLTMGGFYLVAGSVRRDRERGVGAILAATPLSKTAYLGGKFAAHFAYLLVLDAARARGGPRGVRALRRRAVLAASTSSCPYLLLTAPGDRRRSPRSPCSST